MSTTTTTTSTKPPLLVCFGNPLLDITCVVTDDTLHKRYNLPIDGQLEVTQEQRKLFDHVLTQYPVEYTAGGCALNSSRVLSWVLMEGKRVVFVGGIGKDENAKKLSSIVEESGVITRFVEVEEQPTGVCVALVLGTSRCLSADIGAANTCLPHHVFNPSLLPVLESVDFLYVEGYFITHSFPAALQIAEYAQKQGKIFLFNLCGSYVCENHPEELRQILPLVDMLFGSLEEYEALDRFVNIEELSDMNRGEQGNICHDLLKVLKVIRKNQERKKKGEKIGDDEMRDQRHVYSPTKRRIVVVTDGPNPILYGQGGTVTKRNIPSMSPEDIVDTTGAGDAFVGGFLAALCSYRASNVWFDCGVWTAQQLLRQKGCSLPPYPADFLMFN